MEAIAIARQLEQKEPSKNSNGVEITNIQPLSILIKSYLVKVLVTLHQVFSGSYPVSGSFSRSAVNESVGSYSPVSSIVTTIIVMLTLLYATPFLFDLPKATLGIIVIFAVLPLIKIKKMRVTL